MTRKYKTSVSNNASSADALESAWKFHDAWAQKKGWHLRQNNLFVEGETDLRYFELANRHYQRSTGLSLIGDDFAVISVGSGSYGGTPALERDLRYFWEMRQLFGIENQTNQSRILVLLDDDPAGRGVFRSLEKWLRPWLDVFLLRRISPIVKDASSYKKESEKVNAASIEGKYHCEIEDLLPHELVDLFLEENPRCNLGIDNFTGGFHLKLRNDCKGALLRFVEANSGPDDVTSFVDLLKAFRGLLRLETDGSKVI